MIPVADPRYLGLFSQTNPIGPDGVTMCIWAYPHPQHSGESMLRSGYWNPCERELRVGDVVLCSSRHGTSEQHTAFLVRVKGAAGVVVMVEMDPRHAFGGRRAA